MASGKYPHLHELGGKKNMSLGVKAEAFETGLNWLIAGIEAEVGAIGPSLKLTAGPSGPTRAAALPIRRSGRSA